MKLAKAITVVLIALVTIFGIHLVFQITAGLRVDFTEDNLFSLTDGSKAILAKLEDEGVKPIDLKLYFSLTSGKSLPKFIKQFVVYESYVRSLLKEYERAAKGKIKVSFIDPVTDSDDAQHALDYGLDGKPINQHGDLFFFGLVFETQTGSKDVIEFLWPNQQEDIEYEISKKIHSLLWPASQRIGVLSSLEVISSDDPYMAQLMAAQGKRAPESWIAMKLLQESYTVSRIETETDHISKDEYDLLMVIHPRTLPEKTLWAIDEWVTTGGNAFIMLDPFSIDDQPPPNPQNQFAAYQYKPSSNLERLTSGWGVKRTEDAIAADVELGLRRPVSRTSGPEKVIIDLSISEENRDDVVVDHPITRGLNNLRFFMAGRLAIDAEAEATITPLITTTDKGGTLEIKPGFPSGNELTFMDANNPSKLRDSFSPGTEPVVLACLISGKLPSAFPNGGTFASNVPEPPPGLPPGVQMPPPEDAEMITKQAVPEEERGESTVMLFADVDFISNQVAFQQSFFGPAAANDNHKVMLNGVDFLLGAQELMDVRAKSSISRPFIRFDKIEEKADAESQEREKELRADVQRFQEEMRTKQSELSQRNAQLFEKKLQDEVDSLNEKIQEGNRELREIRKGKRAAIEREEAWVRFSIMWLMPILVFVLGMTLYVRRKVRENRVEGAVR